MCTLKFPSSLPPSGRSCSSSSVCSATHFMPFPVPWRQGSQTCLCLNVYAYLTGVPQGPERMNLGFLQVQPLVYLLPGSPLSTCPMSLHFPSLLPSLTPLRSVTSSSLAKMQFSGQNPFPSPATQLHLSFLCSSPDPNATLPSGTPTSPQTLPSTPASLEKS